MVAQGAALVIAAKQATALQFRDHQIDKIGERTREMGGQDVEAVGGALDKPFSSVSAILRAVPQTTQWPRAAAVKL